MNFVSSKKYALLFALFLSLSVLVTTVFGAPIQVGPHHTIEYQGRSPEVPSASEMTFYYTIFSGSGQGINQISHTTFDLELEDIGACLVGDTAEMGTWSASRAIDPLSPPDCNGPDMAPIFGQKDSGIINFSSYLTKDDLVLKFDTSFAGAVNICFTVSANTPSEVVPGTVDFYTKSGGDVQTAEVTGPTCGTVVTSVELDSLSATVRDDDSVSIDWETVSEDNNAGFNVYRSDAADGELTKVNTAMIAANGQGSSYSISDNPGAGTWWYTLEDIDMDGTRTSHGPESVVVGEGERAPTAITLSTFSSDNTASPVVLLAIAALLLCSFVMLQRRFNND